MDLQPILKLSKDLKEASTTLQDAEARFLVDAYYQMQGDRIRADNQVRSLSESEEPHEVLIWLGDQSRVLENEIKKILGVYVKSHIMGDWMLNVKGIGDVLSAGLLAHIDINIADTAGKIWSYAGIDVGKLDKPWEKGQKRPWNAQLKTLCWKIGESFVKVSNKDGALYGNYYAEQKELLVKKNEAGGFSELAERYLEKYKYSKTTEAYKAYIEKKLPDGHAHAMAKRKAVKLFLSHLQQLWYEKHHGKPAPLPFAIGILNHKDYITPK